MLDEGLKRNCADIYEKFKHLEDDPTAPPEVKKTLATLKAIAEHEEGDPAQ